MTVLLKVAHFAALSLWCGGLLILPGLYGLGAKMEGKAALYRLHRFCRFAYVAVISPSAFVTIGTGIALIFAGKVFAPWMGVKLVAVAILVALHVRAGQLVNIAFERGRGYGPWRRLANGGAVLTVILFTLWLVLAKPAIHLAALPRWMREPGGLHSLAEMIVPIP